MESYCLPILTYATVAMYLSSTQLNEFNACCNSVYRRIFCYNKWESVRSFIKGLGRLHFVHLRLHLRLKFHKNSFVSNESTFSYVMKLLHVSDSFNKLCEHVGLSVSERRRFVTLPIHRLR